MHKSRFSDCTSVDLTVVQASNQRLYKHRISSCTSIDLVISQASIVERLNRRIHRRMEGYIDYIKKSINVFNPFRAAVV